MRISYNSPVILSFTLFSFFLLVLNNMAGGWIVPSLFAVYPHFDYASPLSYARLVSHVAGHKDWTHVASNFAIILLIGPILEEKYGSKALLKMMGVTALMTGILNVCFFSTGLMGASGLVFMMILLGSFTNFKTGDIPLTFILVVVMFLSREMADILKEDEISQFAHIIGGACGGLFGFLSGKKNRKRDV